MSLGAACGDDEGSGVTPTPSASTEDPTPADAAVDAESPATSEDESSSTAETLVEAGPDLPDAAPTGTGDHSSMPVPEVDAGDAGPDGGGGLECSVGSEEGATDSCEELAADNWCESPSAFYACSAVAFLRDASIYEAFVSCMNDAFEPSNACDGDVDAAVGECFAAADATACPVHVEACEVYEGCETETVEECNQVAAKYNDAAVSIFADYLYCGYPPAAAFGE